MPNIRTAFSALSRGLRLSALMVAVALPGACAYSNERLFSESEGQITVSSGGVAQEQPREPAESRPENAPLVIIRFDRPEVAFGLPLAQVVERTRTREPGAAFDIVTVSPSLGEDEEILTLAQAGRERGEQVYATMTDLGLTADALSLASTVSPAVTVNEVHIYLR